MPFLSRSLLLGLLLVCGTASGQLWDARKMIAAQGSSGIVSLRAEGKEVAQVDRARVAKFIEVVDKVDARYGFSPDVVLVAGKSPNAFATRTKEGKPVVGVNAAMLDVAANDADMAAVVVGHELAHLKLNHLEEGKARETAINIIALIAGAAAGYNVAKRGGDGTSMLQLAGVGGLLVNRKFDRDQERDADVLGMTAMHEAGYDPHAALRLWVAMQRFGSGSGLWTSTHPSHDERIETLTKLAGELRPAGAAPSTMIASVAPSSVPQASGAPSGSYAFSGDDGWCVVWNQTADCRFKDWQSCKARGSDCRTRSALQDETARVAIAPQQSGSEWCLTDPDGSNAKCEFSSWSACDDKRPDSNFRCMVASQARPPAKSGATLGWCLTDADGKNARCEFDSWSACDDRRPDQTYRCTVSSRL